ncbi:MAG: hypothetical protein HYT37_00700 [Candidatus Sungbacteria bacterium]|nr:hypothetical protein [Candidatus Sungbacteria bacterium]
MSTPKRIERIVLLNLDSFASGAGVQKILRALHGKIVLVCSSQRFGGKYGSFFRQFRKNLSRSGFLFVIYQGLNLSFYYFLAHCARFLRRLGIPWHLFSLYDMAREYNIPFIEVKEINTPQVINRIKENNPDLVISFYFDHKIGRDIIQIPSYGILNTHTALLPKCRGPFPIMCSFMRNISGAITIHAVDETLDTGAIYAQVPYDLDSKYDILFHDRNALSQSADVLLELIAKMEYGDVIALTQESEGFYVSFPTKNDINRLYRCGIKLFSLKRYFREII